MIGIELDNKIVFNLDVIQSPNLCDRFTDDDLKKIGSRVGQGYDADMQSRAQWEQLNENGMDLAMQIAKTKTFPWAGCSNVVFPLVTIGALQFSARSYQNVIQGNDLVKYVIAGEDTKGELYDRACRIGDHMSWQFLQEELGWEEEHDKLLIHLSIVGSAFVKSYYSVPKRRNANELVMAKDFVLNYFARSVDDCPRKTHLIPLHRNSIYEQVKAEIFRDILDEGWYKSPTVQPAQPYHQDQRAGKTPPPVDDDTPIDTLEQHCLLDLDDDGYAEPYIVTIEKNSKNVLRMVARVDSENQVETKGYTKKVIQVIRPTEYFTKFSFIPSPDGGIYDIGFGRLLGPLNEGVNTGINQLFDAGTMSSTAGGFIGRGAKMRGGNYSMAPWEWRKLEATGDDIRKNIFPLPVREPSTVIFQLIGLLINYTDRVAGTTDAMVGINPGQNTPAETSRNMLEQGMQVYSTIFKRVWRSFKEEFKKNHRLNGIYLPAKKRFGGPGQYIYKEDYTTDPDQVAPVADPNLSSAGMRFAQAQSIREASMQSPGGYDREKVEINFLKAMRVQNYKEIYPGLKAFPPAPDPKMQIETAKIEVKKLELRGKMLHVTNELREAFRLNNAKIMQLQAQAYALITAAQTDASRSKVEAFDIAINALEAHNRMIDGRLTALGAAGGETDGEDSSDQGGVPGMAQPTGDPNDAGAAENVDPESTGTME